MGGDCRDLGYEKSDEEIAERREEILRMTDPKVISDSTGKSHHKISFDDRFMINLRDNLIKLDTASSDISRIKWGIHDVITVLNSKVDLPYQDQMYLIYAERRLHTAMSEILEACRHIKAFMGDFPTHSKGENKK